MKRIAGVIIALVALSSHADVSVTERTQINLLRGSTTIETLPGWPECQARARALALASTATSGTVTYTCQTERRQVIAAYSPTPPPPPPPPPPPAPASGVLFTDLASAPSCAMVRQYGFNAGMPVVLAIVAAADAGIPIHQGRCLAADPSTIKTVWAGVQPGDVVQLASGTYGLDANGRGIGEGGWAVDSWLNTFKRGTAAQPIALTAAPGAAVTVSQTTGHNPIYLGGNNQQADYITISALHIVGVNGAVSGGAVTYNDQFPESGSTHARIVGNVLEITNATGNTQDGILSAGGDGWKVLGNTFVDPPNRAVINNNHLIYIQNGADDVEVGWNRLVNAHVGHTIQVHQDGAPMLYERIWIHDNFAHADDPNQMRGFTVSNVQPASTVRFERNRSEGVGWSDWGCLQVMRGTVASESDECVGTHGGILLNAFGSSSNIGPGIRTVTINNALLCPAAGYKRTDFQGGAVASELTETNPRACQ